MAQDRQGLSLGPGEPAAFKGAGDGAACFGIDGLGGRQELLVGPDEHRHIARKGLRKGQKLHFHPDSPA